MCSISPYDLICSKCREKWDKLYEKQKDITLEKEKELWRKAIELLCIECREDLTNEGFI